MSHASMSINAFAFIRMQRSVFAIVFMRFCMILLSYRSMTACNCICGLGVQLFFVDFANFMSCIYMCGPILSMLFLMHAMHMRLKWCSLNFLPFYDFSNWTSFLSWDIFLLKISKIQNLKNKIFYWKVFSFLLNLNLNAASKVSKKTIIVVVYRFRAITHLQDIL